MKRSIKSIMAFALAASLAASTLAPATTSQAASKSNVVTKQTDNSGYTWKYSYNKKGLVTKKVGTTSYKESDSDHSTTTTITYKYNKKNKIATKTAKTVDKATTYETDKTTGLKLGAKKGTVTTTTSAVTKFTYNKKGLATQSVTTTTVGKSGSNTETEKTRGFSGGWDDDFNLHLEATELEDGRILAGYNEYSLDGKWISSDEYSINNAFFYAPGTTFAIGEDEKTTKTEYKDNGNGSYTTTTTVTEKNSGIKTEPVYQYYAKDANNNPVAVTRTEETKTVSDGDTYTYVSYKDATGKEYSGYSFKVCTQVNVTADPKSSSSTTTVTTDDETGKTVTTTKYTYDKKKRVKKAVSTSVTTDGNKKTIAESSNMISANSSSTSNSTKKSESTSESTTSSTTTYAYNKKGYAKKINETTDGKEDSKSTASSEMTVSSSSETTNYNSDGTVSSVVSRTYAVDNYPSTTTKVVSNGVKTITTTKNAYTSTSTSSTKDATGKVTSSDSHSISHTYYANGGDKSVDTYSETNAEGATDAGTTTSYQFDKDGKVTGYEKVVTAGTDRSSAYYTENGKSEFSLDAANKINAAKATLEATGTPFSKVETDTVIATPSKSTTVYKYDKSGNVKSAKTSGTETKVTDAKNETYGNTIYVVDAAGKLKAKQVTYTHKYTDKDAMENTVKKGTKRLTKKLTVNTGTSDREKSAGSYLSRKVFSIKSKKGSTNADKQQWIIQNGALNGVVGLD
ncbi:MAG: hypothetical protein K6G76_10985 [Lachnospiraceae bacterium]|nr:hypothetical protein [Lachnospiraceae bacterium]